MSKSIAITKSHVEIKCWAVGDLTEICERYARTEPNRWAEILRMDDEQGFITNEANSHLVEAIGHIHGSAMHISNNRSGAVALRFMMNSHRGFRAWQPECFETRANAYNMYRNSARRILLSNGKVIWSQQQMASLCEWLRGKTTFSLAELLRLVSRIRLLRSSN